MKITLSLLITILFCSMSVHSQTAQPKGKKKAETIVIKTTIYCDHCKICESCGGRILKQLYNEKGIKDTEVNAKANTITVIYNPTKITAEAIKTKISKLGFDADDVKADPEAVAKLDDCCKKPS
jgi:periplasmic mercuric ion binding protein